MNTTITIIFIITYLGIIFTRLPKINIDRPSAAFFGAVAMIVFGAVTFEEAIQAIDFNTIGLLLGMMIMIAVLELDGFFSLIAQTTLSISKNANQFLFLIVFATGICSAFLVNDAVVLLFTPIIIKICRNVNLNPIPFLIAEILASNVGSAMSITGNPQNMLIGINSNITYGVFLLQLMPISFIGMLVIVMAIQLIYRKQTINKPFNNIDLHQFEYHYTSMKFSVPILILVIVGFFIGHLIHYSIPVIALTGGALVLIFGHIKPSKIIKEIDWVLLLFFASLFIVVHAFEKTGFLQQMFSGVPLQTNLSGISFIHGLSLVASQIVSNVPFTIVMLPAMKSANSDLLWLSLASASTLAGNATIIGAMANLIVIESAEKMGVKIKFFEFLKSGLIVTLITLLLSTLILFWQLHL